jgi:hypothetical protein
VRKFKDAGKPVENAEGEIERIDVREWRIDLPYGAVKRVRDASEQRFNLLDNERAIEIWSDEEEFWELLWYVLEPQAKARNIDAAEFGERMAAACIFEAKRLFYEEWADFFRALQRPEKALPLEKILEYQADANRELLERMSGQDGQSVDSKARASISKRLTIAFGDLLGQLDLPPSGAPGVSLTKPPKADASIA